MGGGDIMAEIMESINKHLEDLALQVVTLEEGDIPAMGKMINVITELEQLSPELSESAFSQIVKGIKGYLEKLVLEEVKDIGPLEEGITVLQNLCRALDRGESFQEDIGEVLKQLGVDPGDIEAQSPGPEEGQETMSQEMIEDAGNEPSENSEQDTEHEESKAEPDESMPEQVEESPDPEDKEDSFSEGPVAISEEDREIISDFVVEALENLATIEVNIIELEQNPEDLETINAIFRPFHTIKGVSGFLNLTKINKLSHTAENLLDKARNGELSIDENVIDIILEAVDFLKRMIEGVKTALESDGNLDIGLDIQPIVKRIEEILSKHEKVANKPLGEILVEKGAVKKEELDTVLEEQKKNPEKKVGEILVEKGAVESKEIVSALREQKRFGGKKMDLQVKVDTKKLDTLVDMTGELVITQSMIRQNEKILSISDQKLYHALNQLNQITTTLQKTAMSMRMVPIRSTFQKMVRLVRDLAKNSGKDVMLTMTGEDTEIDRNVVEELYEPMVHMIRNAVDHGIELPEERKKVGKDPKGVIELRAYQKGSNIVIEIADDGKGLDKGRIYQKALEKNLIAEDTKLTDSEIYNLIFQPGFSTAKQITDISGRGVGMDVVKKAIDKLRGRVEIKSVPGKGSTFVISLPLTLAIIEGMVVRVKGERYIIPALAILQAFRPQKDQYGTVKGQGEVVSVRGELVPLVRLDRIFGSNGDSKNPWEALVVAVEHEGQKMCLLLDELLGKEEVVIKSLGESLKKIKGLAGGAIMGDGKVSLILDMAGLFEIALKKSNISNNGMEQVAS